MKSLKFFITLLVGCGVLTLSAQSDTLDLVMGVRYMVQEEGQGPQPQEGQEVGFHVTTMQEDGTPVFSTKEGLGFPVYDVINQEQDAKLAAAMSALRVGGTNRMFVPKEALSEDDDLRKLPGDVVIFEIELLEVGAPKQDIAKLVAETLEEEGLAAAEAQFAKHYSAATGEIVFREGPLNMLGYTLMRDGQLEEAVAVFKMNVTAHPDSFNVYDSLGDGYLALAKQQYEQALKHNPESAFTKEKLAKF